MTWVWKSATSQTSSGMVRSGVLEKAKKAKVLNKALGNIQDKKGKIMPEYKLRKADRPKRTKW